MPEGEMGGEGGGEEFDFGGGEGGEGGEEDFSL